MYGDQLRNVKETDIERVRAEPPAYYHGLLSLPGHLSGILGKEKALRCYDPAQSWYAYKSPVEMAG